MSVRWSGTASGTVAVRSAPAPHGLPVGRDGRLDVELLAAWTYRDQRPGTVSGNNYGTYWPAVSADGVARCAENAALGCSVSSGGFRRNPVQDLALSVDRTVAVIGGYAATLIRRHGCAGSRPDWGEGLRPHFEPRWKDQPRYDAGGLPVGGSFDIDRAYYPGSNAVRATWCPVMLHEPQDLIDARRAAYSVWWEGLAALAGAMRDAVGAGVVVVPPLCPAEPWRKGLAR